MMATIKKINYQNHEILDFTSAENKTYWYWKKRTQDTHTYKKGETVELNLGGDTDVHH